MFQFICDVGNRDEVGLHYYVTKEQMKFLFNVLQGLLV